MIRSGRLWPWGLGLVLGATVVGNLWVMRVAAADPSFAIEPDYYRKAVAWDEALALEARSAATGWQVAARLGAPEPAGGTPVALELRDAEGRVVEGATVRLAASHNARGAERLHATLTQAPGGAYAGWLPSARRGLWEIRVEAERGAERFAATLRADNTAGPPR